MKKVAVMVCVVFWMTDVYADLPSFPICEDIYPQSAPAIDGSLAAWADERNGTGNADIYARTLPGGTEREICTVPGSNQTAPAVSGSIIVWQDSRKGTGEDDIYAYDISTELLLEVCTDNYNQQYPDISGRIIVWQEYNGSNWDIYGINLDGGSKFAICTAPGDQQYPAISGHYVVWMDNRNGNYDIYGCDLNITPLASFPICTEATANQYYPDIDGSIVVWQDERNTATKPDIYGEDLTGGGELEVCVYAERQNLPAICGNRVVWRDRRNGSTNYDIYGYDIKAGTIEPICTATGHQDTPAVSQHYVVWQDSGLGDIYGAAFPVEASITVVSPNGGETFVAGSQHSILWQSSGAVSTVKIELFDGSNWQTLTDNVANAGSLTVDIPAVINSQQCLIRISDTASPAVNDQSDAIFTVFQCSLAADLTGDCFVDLEDFSLFAQQWLVCGNPFDEQWCQNN